VPIRRFAIFTNVGVAAAVLRPAALHLVVRVLLGRQLLQSRPQIRIRAKTPSANAVDLLINQFREVEHPQALAQKYRRSYIVVFYLLRNMRIGQNCEGRHVLVATRNTDTSYYNLSLRIEQTNVGIQAAKSKQPIGET